MVLTRLVRIRGGSLSVATYPPPRRVPTPIRTAIDTTRAQACVFLDACTTVTPSFSSPDPLRRSSTDVRIRTRYVYDTRRTASARVNAPTAYTAHPACVYALPLARKRL